MKILRLEDLSEAEKKRLDIKELEWFNEVYRYRLNAGYASYDEKRELPVQIKEFERMIAYAKEHKEA